MGHGAFLEFDRGGGGYQGLHIKNINPAAINDSIDSLNKATFD